MFKILANIIGILMIITLVVWLILDRGFIFLTMFLLCVLMSYTLFFVKKGPDNKKIKDICFGSFFIVMGITCLILFIDYNINIIGVF